MAAHVIVLANRTAAAPELIEALVHRSERGPIHATLVMPAGGPGTAARAECKERLDRTLEAWRAAGIERCEGVVCDPVPLEALAEVWDPLRHDEVIVWPLGSVKASFQPLIALLPVLATVTFAVKPEFQTFVP